MIYVLTSMCIFIYVGLGIAMEYSIASWHHFTWMLYNGKIDWPSMVRDALVSKDGTSPLMRDLALIVALSWVMVMVFYCCLWTASYVGNTVIAFYWAYVEAGYLLRRIMFGIYNQTVGRLTKHKVWNPAEKKYTVLATSEGFEVWCNGQKIGLVKGKDEVKEMARTESVAYKIDNGRDPRVRSTVMMYRLDEEGYKHVGMGTLVYTTDYESGVRRELLITAAHVAELSTHFSSCNGANTPVQKFSKLPSAKVRTSYDTEKSLDFAFYEMTQSLVAKANPSIVGWYPSLVFAEASSAPDEHGQGVGLLTNETVFLIGPCDPMGGKSGLYRTSGPMVDGRNQLHPALAGHLASTACGWSGTGIWFLKGTKWYFGGVHTGGNERFNSFTVFEVLKHSIHEKYRIEAEAEAEVKEAAEGSGNKRDRRFKAKRQREEDEDYEDKYDSRKLSKWDNFGNEDDIDRIYDRRMSRQEQKYRNDEYVSRVRGEHESRMKVVPKERKEFTVEQQRAAIEELTKVRKLNEKYAQMALEQVVEAVETKESSDFYPPPEVPSEGKIRAKAKQGRDKSMDCSSAQTHSQSVPHTILEEPETTSNQAKTSELLATLLGELAGCQEQDKSTKLLQLLISTSLDFKENSISQGEPKGISCSLSTTTTTQQSTDQSGWTTVPKKSKLRSALLAKATKLVESSGGSLSLPEKTSIKSLRKLIRELSPASTEPQHQDSPTV